MDQKNIWNLEPKEILLELFLSWQRERQPTRDLPQIYVLDRVVVREFSLFLCSYLDTPELFIKKSFWIIFPPSTELHWYHCKKLNDPRCVVLFKSLFLCESVMLFFSVWDG